MTATPDVVLLVDDNVHDAELVVLTLRKHQPDVTVRVARDGAEAVAMLEAWPDSHPPYLILLDLKMPKADGFEVLRHVKRDASTRSIPVVILTSSVIEKDVQLAYSLGANSYVVKPMGFEEFTRTVSGVSKYWLLLNHRVESEG